jgi:hypothetical protein
MADNERNTTQYKLVTYKTVQGPRAGAVSNEAVFDLSELTGRPSYATMLGVLDDLEAAETLIEAAVAKKGSGATPSSPLTKIRLLVPVLYPSVIFCA